MYSFVLFNNGKISREIAPLKNVHSQKWPAKMSGKVAV